MENKEKPLSSKETPLSEKGECKYMLSGVCEHCLAEAVARLNEAFPINCREHHKFHLKINEIMGRFE